RHRGEIGPRAMRHELDLVAAAREIARERVVRRIHAAERREITRDDEPPVHDRRGRFAIAPCRQPSRNQNWSPVAVPNGTKLNTSGSVPKFAAITAAAHNRSSESRSVWMNFRSYATVTPSATR